MSSVEIPKFSIHYFKTKPIDLNALEKEFESTLDDNHHDYNAFNIQNLQTFNPQYATFFELTDTNYNRISLNHKYHISTLSTVFDQETKESLSKPVFIKFSPLLDPVRYMIGKYKIDNNSQYTLPKLKFDQITISGQQSKILDPNNASYVDNFFSYLTSKLLHQHNIINGVDYYGSYLGIQDKFKMNVTDDIEYLNTSNYFLEKKNKLFTITNEDTNEFTNFGSRTNKQKLRINSESNHNISGMNIVSLDDERAAVILPNEDDVNINAEIITDDLLQSALVYVTNTSAKSSDSSSTDSSSNSETNYSTDNDENDDDNENDDNDNENDDNDGNEKDDNDDDNNSDEWESIDSSNFSTEDTQFAYINNFPVQLICLEKCDGTIDELFEKEQIGIDESASALFQVIMSLIAYQKAFHFTHNDLHTNNIMYVNTPVKFLYYLYKNNTYKVPTYGKIYKIIDFGRSIYRFNGQIFCSDSFATGGDAATQYNCEPYMNENKPRLDPNYSFDLTRLGCSLYDFIIEDEHNIDKFNELQKTVYRWCTDDNDKNVLYKKNGDERYPNFKLYKMIARTVHKHTPQDQLNFPFFKQFLMSSNAEHTHSTKPCNYVGSITTESSPAHSGSGSLHIVDLDKMPCYV